MMATAIKLTKLERDILAHRLDCDSAIADALDGDDTTPGYHCEDVIAVAKSLLQGLGNDGLDTSFAEATLGGDFDHARLIREVLADCVEGSTYYGGAVGSATRQQLAAIERAGDSLAAKVSQFIGRKVEFPAY